jgi:hypothetical protein
MAGNKRPTRLRAQARAWGFKDSEGGTGAFWTREEVGGNIGAGLESGNVLWAKRRAWQLGFSKGDAYICAYTTAYTTSSMSRK